MLCAPVRLELLYSARGNADFAELSYYLDGFRELPLDAQSVGHARRAQEALAAKSRHRGPTPVDLLISGIAHARGAIVLHYDRHFDAIARVTGQPMEWIARRGSLGA